MTTHTTALQELLDCTGNLDAALKFARNAAQNLEPGPRATRTQELIEKIGDAVMYGQRIMFAVESDIRYEQALQAANNGIRLVDLSDGQWKGYDR